MERLVLLVLITYLSSCLAFDWSEQTSLDDYVNRVDENLPPWEKIDEYDMEDRGCYAHVINFTSQIWKDESVSSRPVWFHYLLVFLPRQEMTYNNAGVMFIEGGGNTGSPPSETNEFVQILCATANLTGASTALLRMIPNQPIKYPDDPDGKERTEDANIAWTWKKFIEDPSDPEILLQFPMTKGAKRALDTYSEVVEELTGDKVDQFTVAGGSKRGWITWLLACVDPRVQVAAPVVLSVLNIVPNLHKQWRSLGGWTYVFNDYYEVNITSKLDDPNTALMAEHIDPLSYKERLTMPKVLMVATGDEFFMPDDSHMFWGELPEPKYMMLVENTNHGMIGAYDRLVNTLVAFFIHMQESTMNQLPSLTWTREEYEGGGAIEIETSEEPIVVRGFWADTLHEQRRDFRLTTADGLQPIIWRREDNGINGTLERIDDLRWRLDIPISDTANFRGFILNVEFEGPREDMTFEVTSEIQIIPDTFPFEDCEGESCYGTIV